MSFGGSSGGGTSTTQIDPQLKADWEQLFGQAQATAAAPTPQQGVAGFTPTGVAGQQATIAAAGAGQQPVMDAIDVAKGVSGWTPGKVTGAQAGGITSQSTPDSAMLGTYTVDPGQLSNTNLQPYMNPYTQDVTNTTLQQLDMQRRQALNGNTAAATAQGGEGAWNGSRAGVADSLTNKAFADTAASTLAGLNSQNFGQAQGAAQQDIGTSLAAQQANQQTGLQQGLTKYGGTLQTNLANMNAVNSISEANAARQQQADLANLDAQQQAEQIRLGGAGALGALGGQQQAQALTGAQAISGVGQQQQALSQQQADTQFQNEMLARNLPLQTVESAFGIIPTTASGGSTVSHSSGKTGSI
jgi:hypothetical protein